MGRNVIARQDGDDYQAKFFWLKACGLNHPHACIAKVAWEVDTTFGFDDVVVYYEPAIMESGSAVREEYFQIKFHVDHVKGFTWKALMDAEFIGAQRDSLLERLYKIYKKDPIKFPTCRYSIINTWGVDYKDHLGNLLSNTGGIRLEVLFKGGEGSKYGKIRKAWKDHLGITDDEELKSVLAPLRIKHSYDDEHRLKENLNNGLALAGLKPIPADQRSGKYSDLIQKLHKAGQNVFTKEELFEICNQEGLLVDVQEAESDVFVVGVRSFQKGAEALELEVHTLVCLLHCFSSRFILEEYSGTEYINKEISELAQKVISSKKRIILHLDTHLSIALLLGYHLDSKYGGLDITVVQKTFAGKIFWKAEADKIREYQGPFWTNEEKLLSEDGSDLAITISITHDIRPQVNFHIQEQLPSVKKCFHQLIYPKTGSTSIKDANHIIAAVEDLVSLVRIKRQELVSNGRIHLFISAPNAFAFFLGQRIKPFGNVTLYEFDFENQRDGGYHSIINIP